MRQIEIDRPGKTTSLTQIAEINPSIEDVINLRNGYKKLLDENGHESKGKSMLIFRMGLLVNRSRAIEFLGKVEIDDKSIPIHVWQFRNKTPERESLYINMGMRTNGGELVVLELSSLGGAMARWKHPQRGGMYDAPGDDVPTKKDLALHVEALELLKKQLVAKQT